MGSGKTRRFARGAVGVVVMLIAGLIAAAPASATFPGQNGKIYFEACFDPCGTFDIYSVNPDGTGLDNVTDVLTDPAGRPDNAFDPSVTQDGTRMVLGVDTQAESQIWAINTDGSNPQQLTNDLLLDQEPSISADGTKVVWNQWSPNPCPPGDPGCVIYGDRDIWLMNANGSSKELLFDGFGTDLFPEFTPDGQTVVMEAETGDQDIQKIPSIPAAPPLQVGTPVAGDDALLENEPSVSPDGARVAFSQRPVAQPCCSFDIYATSINGGPTTPIADTADSEFSPSYSPDGTKIAYISSGATTTVLIANADGSAPAPLDLGSDVVSIGGLEWVPAVAGAPETGPAADTNAPDTTITKAPKKKSKKKRATIEFSSSETGSSFRCSVDGEAPKATGSCTSPLTVKVKKGKHSFEVQALDVAGNADPSPATASWKVRKKKKNK